MKPTQFNVRLKPILVAASLFLSLDVLANPPSQVIAETVKQAPFRDHIEALGTLRANESVGITAQVTESVTAIHFEDGQDVKKGQLLVEMTSSEERALLVEAQTNAGEAKKQLERIKSLSTQGGISQSQVDERRRDFEAAQARLIATQSRLSDRMVNAPFAGQLGLRNISVGALVRPGDLITTLTDNSQMKLDFNVPAVMLSHLKLGLPILATSDAYPKREFIGTLSSIDNQIDRVTRSIRVRALLKNEDKSLKQGMLLSIDLYYNERNTLVISEEAIIPEGESSFVFILDETLTKAEKTKITLGSRRQGQAEVLRGLSDGNIIVTHGGFKLRPGSTVVVQNKQELSE